MGNMFRFAIFYVVVLDLVFQNVLMDQSVSEVMGSLENIILQMNHTIQENNKLMQQNNELIQQIQQENMKMKSEVGDLAYILGNGNDTLNVSLVKSLSELVMTQMSQIKQENSRLKIEISMLRDQTGNDRNNSLNFQHHVNSTSAVLRGTMEHVLSKMSRRVFFSVYITEGYFRTTVGQRIPLKGVAADSGNNFNIGTSKFRCPVGGEYFFIYTLFSSGIGGGHTYQRSRAELVVDGDHRAEVYSYNTGGSTYLQASNSVITHCPAGGHVWLQGRGRGQMWGSSTDRRTTFSGFLLK